MGVGAGEGTQTRFVVRALVSDRALGASSHDPQLVNAYLGGWRETRVRDPAVTPG